MGIVDTLLEKHNLSKGWSDQMLAKLKQIPSEATKCFSKEVQEKITWAKKFLGLACKDDWEATLQEQYKLVVYARGLGWLEEPIDEKISKVGTARKIRLWKEGKISVEGMIILGKQLPYDLDTDTGTWCMWSEASKTGQEFISQLVDYLERQNREYKIIRVGKAKEESSG